MNQDVMLGRWPQLRNAARQFFPELTDNDLAAIDHSPDAIISVLQKRYGYTREEASAALDRFVSVNGFIVDADPK